MTEISTMKKRMSCYGLILFDMDGTLYFQRPLRLEMGARLASYYLLRPHRIKELLALKKYRQLRERVGGAFDPVSLYEEAGQGYHMTADRTEAVIQRWMYRMPYRILKKYRDDGLWALIRILQEEGIRTAVYSDYPARGKMEALEMEFPYCFCGEDPLIRSLKPDPKGILKIMEQFDVKKEDVLMVGDRLVKDGAAAAAAGVDYLILPSGRRKRRKMLKRIMLCGRVEKLCGTAVK